MKISIFYVMLKSKERYILGTLQILKVILEENKGEFDDAELKKIIRLAIIKQKATETDSAAELANEITFDMMAASMYCMNAEEQEQDEAQNPKLLVAQYDKTVAAANAVVNSQGTVDKSSDRKDKTTKASA